MLTVIYSCKIGGEAGKKSGYREAGENEWLERLGKTSG
jgi:hypothetical protein